MWIKGKLNVTPPFNLQSADYFKRSVPQHVVFFVGQRLTRSNNNRIACMYANRIQVLHVTDNYSRIISVSDYFIFNFFESFNAFFDKNLTNRRQGQCCFHSFAQLFGGMRKTAAGSPQSKCWTQDNWITNFFGGGESLFYIVGDF